MAKHPDYVLRNNAIRGAVTTWCPHCKRKSALSAHKATVLYTKDGLKVDSGRRCRYCKKWVDSNTPVKQLYREWLDTAAALPSSGPRGAVSDE